MNNEIIYAFIGIVTLVFVIIVAVRGNNSKVIKTKEQKKAEIIAQYRLDLQKALSPLKNNQEATVAKKTSMLKKFSDELARNIFFDKNEIRSIILELAK